MQAWIKYTHIVNNNDTTCKIGKTRKKTINLYEHLKNFVK